MTELYVLVEADHNDADYVRKLEKVRGGDEALIRKVAEALHTHRHNWPASEYVDGSPQKLYAGVLTEEEVEAFWDDYVPSSEYGVHTITDIKLFYVEAVEQL